MPESGRDRLWKVKGHQNVNAIDDCLLILWSLHGSPHCCDTDCTIFRLFTASYRLQLRSSLLPSGWPSTLPGSLVNPLPPYWNHQLSQCCMELMEGIQLAAKQRVWTLSLLAYSGDGGYELYPCWIQSLGVALLIQRIRINYDFHKQP